MKLILSLKNTEALIYFKTAVKLFEFCQEFESLSSNTFPVVRREAHCVQHVVSSEHLLFLFSLYRNPDLAVICFVVYTVCILGRVTVHFNMIACRNLIVLTVGQPFPKDLLVHIP